MGLFSNLLGTSKTTAYIGLKKTKLDATNVTAQRNFVLPNLDTDLLNGATGTVLTKGASSISFQSAPIEALSTLSDVSLSSPATGNLLSYNGSEWTNVVNNQPISAGAGVNFFLDDTNQRAIGTNNTNEVNTLNQYPITTTEVVDSLNLTTNTLLKEAYDYNIALGGTQIDAGAWELNVWASVNSVAAGRVSTITGNIYRQVVSAGTVTTTGSGTTRTATVSSDTPFVAGDANASITLCGYLLTPQGLYQISAFTSSTVVSIITPSTYVNETSAAFTTWRYLFSITTPAITAIGTAYTLVSVNIAQSAFSINTGDKLGMAMFATSNNTTTVNFTHNGTAHYSFIKTPLITRHNSLAGLQGGSSNNYYHLTSAQATVATQAASGSQNGYLSSADWTTFNNKGSSATYTLSSQTNTYAIQTSDQVLLLDGTSNTFAATLPTAVGVTGKWYKLICINATNAVNIATTSSQTINGSTTYYFTGQYDGIEVTSNGSNWNITGRC